MPSGVYLIKNIPSEVRSEWCKTTGVEGEQSSISTLSINGSRGEVLVSSWSSDTLENWVGTTEGKDNVALSCSNYEEMVFGGNPNHFSSYNSMFNNFFNELMIRA